MTIGRRGFLLAGGVVAGAGALPGPEARAQPAIGGRSVTDFGVQPNSDADQTDALQAAIEEISRNGHAVYVPGGSYRAEALNLPAKCTIVGDPGTTVLRFGTHGAISAAAGNQSLHLTGLILDGSPETAGRFLLQVQGGEVNVNRCTAAQGGAIAISQASGALSGINARGCGIVIDTPRGLAVSHCHVEGNKAGFGIEIRKGTADGEAVLLTGNHISQCAGGIWLQGAGIVNANFVSGATNIGVKLGGSGNENAAIMATGNNISGCNIGLGVSAGGETIFASLNLITHAKSAAIRAFDGSNLVGPDLARESAESYLNLTVAGNVVR
jgi:polygalacturonase